jgi:hypothetical protein
LQRQGIPPRCQTSIDEKSLLPSDDFQFLNGSVLDASLTFFLFDRAVFLLDLFKLLGS